jgi:hypothetical protein
MGMGPKMPSSPRPDGPGKHGGSDQQGRADGPRRDKVKKLCKDTELKSPVCVSRIVEKSNVVHGANQQRGVQRNSFQT